EPAERGEIGHVAGVAMEEDEGGEVLACGWRGPHGQMSSGRRLDRKFAIDRIFRRRGDWIVRRKKDETALVHMEISRRCAIQQQHGGHRREKKRSDHDSPPAARVTEWAGPSVS